jgi:hypothetical protein
MRTLIAVADVQYMLGMQGAGATQLAPLVQGALKIGRSALAQRLRELTQMGWLTRRYEGPTDNRRNMRTYISELGWQQLAAVGIEKPI